MQRTKLKEFSDCNPQVKFMAATFIMRPHQKLSLSLRCHLLREELLELNPFKFVDTRK